MSTETLTDNTEAAILSRVISPDDATLSPEAAKGILTLSFRDADRQRMTQLAEKARQGTLTPAERDAVENYERIASLLGLLQSKARLSLHSSNADAK